jgi:hypothetical protein
MRRGSPRRDTDRGSPAKKVHRSPTKKEATLSARTAPTVDELFARLSDRSLLSLEQFDLRNELGAAVCALAQEQKDIREVEERLWKCLYAVISHLNAKRAATSNAADDALLLELLGRAVSDADAVYAQLELLHRTESDPNARFGSFRAHCLIRRGDLSRYLFKAGLKDGNEARLFYLDALLNDRSSGHAHNQLGVLAMQQEPQDGLEVFFFFFFFFFFFNAKGNVVLLGGFKSWMSVSSGIEEL